MSRTTDLNPLIPSIPTKCEVNNMPNHVSNRMTVTCPKAERERFKAFVTGKDEEGEDNHLVFEKIIPYPEGFDPKVESSGITFDMKKGQILSDHAYEQDLRERNAKHKWGYSEEKIQEELKSAFAIRAKAQKNIDITGYPTWYEWNIENWGTKWGAYSVELEETNKSLVYDFQTAWSLAEPIFDKLAEEFPMALIEIHVCEEGGFFCGNWIKEAGESSGHFFEAPYPKRKGMKCPYHGTHNEWIDDEEEEEATS